MAPPSRPLMVYDGACDLCRVWIERWRRHTAGAVDYAPYQEVASRFPEVPVERFREAVHLRSAEGEWSRGAAAVFRSLAHAPGRGGAWWLYRRLPGFAWISEWIYRWVSRHRGLLWKLDPARLRGRR